MSRHVFFSVSGLKLAIEADALNAVHESLAVQRVAGTVNWFLGLSVINGKLVPVTDLGAFSGASPSSGRTLELNSAVAHVALRVDEVVGLRDTQPGSSEPDRLTDRNQKTRGVAKRLMLTGQTVHSHGLEHEVLDLGAFVESADFKNIKGTST